jgi:hypothetical protein
MEVSPRTVLAVLAIAGALAFALSQRAQTAALDGPAPDGARYRVAGGGGAGTLELKAGLRDGTFTFAPEVSPADRALVLKAVASSRPEARRLVAMVDGLVDLSIGSAGDGAAGRTVIGGARYPVILDLAGAWQRGTQRAVNRLVMHELAHVIDDALLTDAVVRPLVAAVPRGWGCEEGTSGACAPGEERFAESFAKWATGDIGVDVYLGYAVPPPEPSLESWGRALAEWQG